MTSHAFAGTGRLIRLIARLERVKLSLWLLGLIVVFAITPTSVRTIIDNEADTRGVAPEVILAEQAALLETNSATIALQGPPDALDTFGGRYAFEIGAFMLAIVALMNILLIGRHTRAEEESGRAELVRAGSVGPWSAMAAVATVAVVANVVLGAVTGVVFIADGQPAGPSLVYGVSVALCGIVFAAIALVAVQIFEYGRAATGASLAVLAAAFAVRAVGDVRDSWVSMLSPMGWTQAVDPFGDTRLLPLGIAAVATFGLAALAAGLATRRDVGAGLIEQRPGSPVGSVALGTPLGFAWRLQRSSLAWWTIGLALLGAMYGSVISSIDDFVEENEAMRDVLESMGMTGDALRDGFITVILSITALIAIAGVVQAQARPRSEEVAGRVEPVLARAISRPAWLGSHLLLAAVAAPVFMLGAGIGLGVADAMVVGAFTDFGGLLVASLARVPALWAVAGIGVLLYGFAQRWGVYVWAVFALAAAIFMFGELLQLPDALLNLSPIRHVTHLPGGDQGLLAVVVLTLIGFGAGSLGVVLFGRRDIDTA